MDVLRLGRIYAGRPAPASPFDLIDIRKFPYDPSANAARQLTLAVAGERRDAGTTLEICDRQKLTCRKRESFPDGCHCKSF
jgi:hypothetical protein